MKKSMLMLAMALVAITVGCTKSEQGVVDPNSKNPINISTTITRATDTEFEAGDKIGLYVVNYNGSAHDLTADANHVNNMDFAFDGSVWTPGEEVFWRDMVTKADFYAYYPFTTPIADVNALPWEVKTVQSDENDYWAGDFMWTKKAEVTPTTQAVTLNMKHILSNATVTLVGGTGFEDDPNLESAEVELFFYGVKTAATIDLATGAVTATGNATVVSPWKTEVSTTTGEGDEAVTVTKDIYRAMIIPQTIEAGKTLISVSVNGVVYPLVVEEGFTFAPGKKHNFTLTVNASKVNLTVEIVDWEDVDLDNSDIGPMGQSKSLELPNAEWKALTDAELYGSYWDAETSKPTVAANEDYGVTYTESSFKQAGSNASGNNPLENMWDNYSELNNGKIAYISSGWGSPEGQTYPFSIFIDLGSVVQLDALSLFCQGGRANQNTPGKFRIWVSDDSTPENGILDGWIMVKEEDATMATVGEWDFDEAYVNGHEVTFDRTKPCRYVRFEALEDRDQGLYDNQNRPTVSITELKLFGVQHNF